MTTFDPSIETARSLDASDALAGWRDRFLCPDRDGQRVIYFCGNSLGLQPDTTRDALLTELDDWARLGVDGHFEARNPWFSYHTLVEGPTARLVGAIDREVVVMNALTVNLNLLMVSFYRPEGTRFKVMMEADAFPSDHYAVQEQVRFHGYDPDEAIVLLEPRTGEHALRDDDILEAIDHHGPDLALVMLGGVNYKTGQFFDLEAITRTGQARGAIVGFDLAHAIGNVPLHLHDWNVDFATWCSYKYLNSGPGGVSGIFVHERFARDFDRPRFAGWWGHDEDERFKMDRRFKPMTGAEGWQMSNAPVLAMAAYKASVERFDAVGMDALRAKSIELTGYLESLLAARLGDRIDVLTPRAPHRRGCQLSLAVRGDRDAGRALFDALTREHVVADWREPNVIRVAPVPFYNSFTDVWTFVDILARTA